VFERARRCCEYCLVPADYFLLAHEVDHVIAHKHGGETALDNFALSCARCNKRKGSDIASLDPETGELVALYNPRRDRWTDHFQFSGAEITPRSAIGRTTVRLLQLNDSPRLEDRRLLIEAHVLSIPE
jgi:hypothetical protein